MLNRRAPGSVLALLRCYRAHRLQRNNLSSHHRRGSRAIDTSAGHTGKQQWQRAVKELRRYWLDVFGTQHRMELAYDSYNQPRVSARCWSSFPLLLLFWPPRSLRAGCPVARLRALPCC